MIAGLYFQGISGFYDRRCEGFTETSTTKWCPEAESNHRHEDFQSSALPTELSGLDVKNSCDIPFTG